MTVVVVELLAAVVVEFCFRPLGILFDPDPPPLVPKAAEVPPLVAAVPVPPPAAVAAVVAATLVSARMTLPSDNNP